MDLKTHSLDKLFSEYEENLYDTAYWVTLYEKSRILLAINID